QRALVDLIIATDPDNMTEIQRLRVVSMMAAYVGVQISQISVISIAPANSTRVRLEMPREAASDVLQGILDNDPRLGMFFEQFEILAVHRVPPQSDEESGTRITDTSERGLEALIVTSLIEEAGYVEGDPSDYDREHAVDIAKLLTFLQA